MTCLATSCLASRCLFSDGCSTIGTRINLDPDSIRAFAAQTHADYTSASLFRCLVHNPEKGNRSIKSLKRKMWKWKGPPALFLAAALPFIISTASAERRRYQKSENGEKKEESHELDSNKIADAIITLQQGGKCGIDLADECATCMGFGLQSCMETKKEDKQICCAGAARLSACVSRFASESCGLKEAINILLTAGCGRVQKSDRLSRWKGGPPAFCNGTTSQEDETYSYSPGNLQSRRVDTRSAAGTADALATLYKAIKKVFVLLGEKVENHLAREKYARFARDQLVKAAPDANVVVIYSGVKHSVLGSAWIHDYKEYKDHDGWVGYHAYLSLKGAKFSLTNKGDGGYINWAYSGEFSRSGMTIKAAEYDYRVVAYEHANYGGQNVPMSVGEYDYGEGDIPNDYFSSMYVPSGFFVLIYRDVNFRGETAFVKPGWYWYLGDYYNDWISSMIVVRGEV